MQVDAERLGRSDEAAIEELLEQDPVVNLFLMGFLAVHPVDRAWWYGVRDGPRLTGVILVLPGRLAVPWTPDPDDARRIGVALRSQHRPSLMVGPRRDCDAVWSTWAPGQRPTRQHDQRLYVLEAAPEGRDPGGFRRATYDEWQTIATYSSQMELEDLGIDPSARNPRLHQQVVQERVKAGRTWILVRDDEICFQVNVGTTSWRGCQLGGTYVPPHLRGRGYATVGVAATCRRLLHRYPRVSLHVNEANEAAVRVYEKVGFERSQAFRLITP